MARRKQLKGIAGNLAQWCISRNFDYEGYWAIGQLYAFAEESASNEITLNLKEKVLSPAPREGKFRSSFDLLSKILERDLETNGILDWWVQNVTVIFKFNAEYQHKYHCWGSTIGNPFICKVKIGTDLGKTYENESGCNIWVHNPKKEHRRYGFE